MAEPAQGEVIIYEHTRYGGRSYRTKNSIADLKSVNFDNTVSSIKVGPNTRCSLWANAHYGGASLVVKSSEDNLVAKGFNDKASSLSIQAPEQETIKADGYYSIVSVANGKALDGNVGAAQDKTHPRVFLWDHTPSAHNHQWQLKPIDGTHYVIVNRANGKALDGNIGVPQHSAPHPTPFLWDETPSAQNHQWKFQKVDENTYLIISRANGKALDGNLDVPQSNPSHPSPFLWDPVPHAANHKWKLVRAK